MTSRMRGPATARSHRRPRWAPVLAWAAMALYVVAAAVALWLGVRSHAALAPADIGVVRWNVVNATILVVFATFVCFGALIVSQRPRNAIGWLMVAGGMAFGLTALGDSYALIALGSSEGTSSWLGLAAAIFMVAAVRTGAVLLLVLLPLLYPDGALPSRRWRPVLGGVLAFSLLWLVAGVAAGRLSGTAFPIGKPPIEVYEVANPLAAAWLQPVVPMFESAADVILLVLVLLAVAALVMRFRASRGTDRQQIKWFAFAAGVYVALFALSVVVLPALDVPVLLVQSSQGVTYLSLIAFPAAIGIAVLRHRLYEIDRIISRTVSYGLVVAILVAVYAGAVVALGAAASAATGGGDSDLVVAASTLLVVGLFRPVRTRVQSVVDRRFNRTGYDARQAVETFARDVRDEVDRDRLRRRTAETAATAVEPTHVSLWLPQEHPEQ